MVEETKEPWFPNWRPKFRSWLEEILDFAFIFATVILFHFAFRVGRTAFGLDAALMDFMEKTDHYAFEAIWVLFLLSQVRRASSATLSPTTEMPLPVSLPVNKKKQGRRSKSQ